MDSYFIRFQSWKKYTFLILCQYLGKIFGQHDPNITKWDHPKYRERLRKEVTIIRIYTYSCVLYVQYTHISIYVKNISIKYSHFL